MNGVLLTIIAPPALEDAIVDWLLERELRGFTSWACDGHGAFDRELDAAEQVAGRKRQVAFWIQLPVEEARPLIDQLTATFGAGALHCWMTPLLA